MRGADFKTELRQLFRLAAPLAATIVETLVFNIGARTWGYRPESVSLQGLESIYFGFALVLTAGSPAAVNADAIASFCTGLSRYCGMSARKPYVTVSFVETFQRSCP